MTKEEFGLNLFETITIIGSIMTIDQQRAVTIHRNETQKSEELLKRRQALQGKLSKLLPVLSNQEMDDILARYPWVTGC